MKCEPGWTAPDHDISVFQPDAPGTVVPAQTAKKKNRKQSERHRHNRRAEIALVAVLVQRKSSAWLVTAY
jgi:hypothetical protein